ncbi:Ubiquitin-fold modifier-conjugating enzyme [Parasponia andersonii]|uniref:Ubiquitin-fold modifier-conjugating enzyme n=1 Tax=Parasponia andersonii TaxID=3476 RepID=A0A2P5C046_PARAD|nr:Ubiquitin-fold modifier-conjugating enzyme [Parasponia andersonii]
MASSTSIQFIELALSSNSPFNLSYLDPNQKWLIRDHLISFLQDFPSFTPSSGTFVHDDGMATSLLCVTGDLHISAATPLVPLTIWLHENHPLMPPIVFVTPNSAPRPTLRPDHPFVAPSGVTACPYLHTWAHPRCSLSNLVRNLVRLFSHDHPLSPAPVSAGGGSCFAHPSFVSRREAMDRLAGVVYYDVAKFGVGARREIAELTKLQAEMAKRVEFVEKMVGGFEREKEDLKKRAMELAEQADVVANWLRFSDRERVVAVIEGDEIEKAFETAEAEWEPVLDCLAGDRASEDTIYALDKAVEVGVVTFEAYMKQVRVLAREQFSHRALLVKLRGSSILNWTH